MRTIVLASLAALWISNALFAPLVGPAAWPGPVAAEAAGGDVAPPAAGSPSGLVRGIVRPARRAELAAAVPGVIAEVFVGEGQRVRAGDPIARLDDGAARAALAVAVAAADRRGALALAEARQAALEGGRSPESADISGPPPAPVREARARVLAAREDLAVAAAAATLERRRLEQHVVRAPFDGRIVRIHRDLGEAIAAGEPLAVLVDASRLEVELTLPLASWPRIETGRWHTLDAGSPIGGPVAARMRTAEAYAGSTGGSVRCVLEIPNPGERLPVGFTVFSDASGPPAGSPPPEFDGDASVGRTTSTASG